MASIDLRAAAQQALEALEGGADSWQRVGPAIDALKAALAEPVQEPDSPERRCGGPGCDMTCCQPVAQRGAMFHTHPAVERQRSVEAAVRPACGVDPAAKAEPVQEPVAIVGTQEDTWKGYGGQWAPPGPPIKTVHMLRELPEGTLLYAAPPQRPAEPVQEPVEPVAYIHRQGRHWEVSERLLADDEKARGWTEEPLYTAPTQRAGESVQEPVAWRFEARHIDSAWAAAVTLKHPGPEGIYMRNVMPLYAHPPQRKPLTEAEIDAVWNSLIATPDFSRVKIARAIERAHGIGGEG